jgi:biotin carboxyl carrier protein
VPDENPPVPNPEEPALDPAAVVRSDVERAADHAAIAGSIDELLPALIAKLGATGLAELEIREDALRVRLRRPTDGVAADRRAGDRGGRVERPRSVGSSSPPGHVPGLMPVGPGREARESREAKTVADARDASRPDPARTVATSPAVGIYHPRTEAQAGTRIRAGDRLGTVDMLGVPQDVVAPVDGLVGASLVETGDAVEYGQDLVVIEFATAGAGASGPATPTQPDH